MISGESVAVGSRAEDSEGALCPVRVHSVRTGCIQSGQGEFSPDDANTCMCDYCIV